MSTSGGGEHQSGADGRHEGAVHLPPPSVWPATLAAGVTLLLFGVVGGAIFGVSGAALVALALAGWIGELRRE